MVSLVNVLLFVYLDIIKVLNYISLKYLLNKEYDLIKSAIF